jgi:PAS domain S-box-containing protein
VLEAELFALLDSTADAAYTVTDDGRIRSWNTGAERLFGYLKRDALGRNVDELLEARDALGTRALAHGAEATTRQWDKTVGGIPNFDLEVRTGSGVRIWVNVSTIIFNNRRTGGRLFARLARDITQRKQNDELVLRVLEAARQLVTLAGDASDHTPTSPLSEQELRILKLFAQGRNSTTISRTLKISPQTLRNHLHHINDKLRTHNRLEAVTHAQRRGLIE